MKICLIAGSLEEAVATLFLEGLTAVAAAVALALAVLFVALRKFNGSNSSLSSLSRNLISAAHCLARWAIRSRRRREKRASEIEKRIKGDE